MEPKSNANPYIDNDRAMSNREKLAALHYALEREDWSLLPSIGGVGCPNCQHGVVPEVGRGLWEWHLLCETHRAAGNSPFPHMAPTCFTE
jgi:hypothetical protein